MVFKYDINNIYNWLKFFLIIFALIFIIIIFWLRILVLELHESDNFLEGIMFSILNALIFGMYLNVCGFGIRSSKDFFKYFIMVILIGFIITGFGYFGLSLTINLEKTGIDVLKFLLYYDKLVSNSFETILFMSYNWLLLVIIFFISHILESEIK